MHEIKIVKRASLACCAMRPRRAAWDGDTCPTPSARGRCRHAPRSRASRRLGHRLRAFRRRVSAESCRRVCAPRCLLAPPDPAKPAPLRRRDRLPRALRPRLRCCLIRPPPRLLPPRLCLLAPSRSPVAPPVRVPLPVPSSPVPLRRRDRFHLSQRAVLLWEAAERSRGPTAQSSVPPSRATPRSTINALFKIESLNYLFITRSTFFLVVQLYDKDCFSSQNMYG